jgi:hypothetical protein
LHSSESLDDYMYLLLFVVFNICITGVMYAIYNSSDMLAPFYINFNMTGVGVYNLAHGL